jgi:hypothetical protein
MTNVITLTGVYDSTYGYKLTKAIIRHMVINEQKL